jgi:hypothetical protein
VSEEEAPSAAETLPAYEWVAEPDQSVVPGIPARRGWPSGLRFFKRSKLVVEATAKDPTPRKRT